MPRCAEMAVSRRTAKRWTDQYEAMGMDLVAERFANRRIVEISQTLLLPQLVGVNG